MCLGSDALEGRGVQMCSCSFSFLIILFGLEEMKTGHNMMHMQVGAIACIFMGGVACVPYLLWVLEGFQICYAEDRISLGKFPFRRHATYREARGFEEFLKLLFLELLILWYYGPGLRFEWSIQQNKTFAKPPRY